MGFDRRIVVALSVIALILAPAGVLRALCAGHSCDEQNEGASNVPFCSLPDDRRAGIEAGFREGRSPDVLVVGEQEPRDRVPLLFLGDAFGDVGIPSRTSLDRVAPSLAAAAGVERPHPEVRSGTALEGIEETDARLILVIALKGVDSSTVDVTDWNQLVERGTEVVVSNEATVGSLPLDTTAALTTLGTGGLPSQHGITGKLLRNDSGAMVAAWTGRAPVSVIATLADDLDEMNNQKAKVGLIGSAPADRGLIGGNWYVDLDRDDRRFVKGAVKQVAAARALLRSGYGTDDVPDFLGVALEAPPDRVEEEIAGLLAAARRASNDRLVAAVVGLGAGENDHMGEVRKIERAIEGPTRLIEGAVPAGFFVDQDALTKTGKTEDEVIDAVKETDSFADAFAAITVTFGRYC